MVHTARLMLTKLIKNAQIIPAWKRARVARLVDSILESEEDQRSRLLADRSTVLGA